MKSDSPKFPLTLPKLPYALDALEPTISRRTLEYHYGKHHRAYVKNANELVKGTQYEKKSLEDVVRSATGPIFNNAAQVWNHTFYWNSMSPNSNEDDISPQLRAAIDKQFKSIAAFKKEFSKKATTLFGSGWTWLVVENGKLQIRNFKNADNPLRHGIARIFVVDLWEHAWYLDRQSDKKAYLNAIWDVICWKHASNNFSQRKSE